jgi:ATP synthase protein I
MSIGRPATGCAADVPRRLADTERDDPVAGGDPESRLIYSRGVARSEANDLGRTGAYFALFSEIAIVLLIATLVGVGIGYWADTTLDTLPIFVLVGLILGFGTGALGVYRLVTRFLSRFD